MSEQSPARWLAPLALFAAAFAFAVVIATSGTGGNGGSDQAAQTATTGTGTGTGTTGRTSTAQEETTTDGRGVYVVKPGDNLSTIAEETGVSVERLQQLNPDVDPQALTTGQRLRLRSS
jgi:LysM repeat protein